MLIQPAASNVYRLPDWEPKEGASYRILLAREKKELASDVLRWIKGELTNNKNLRALWPEIVWNDVKRQKVTPWSDDAIVVPRKESYVEPTIATAGVDGAITGTGYDVQVLDDLLTEPRCYSPTETERSVRFWRSTKALCDRFDRLVQITIGTKWPSPDLYTYIRAQNPQDRNDTEYITIYRRSIVENGKPIMPEYFTLDMVEALKREFKTLFPFIFMNSERVPGVSAFNPNDVREYTVKDGKYLFEPDPRDSRVSATLQSREGESRRSVLGKGTKLNRETWDRCISPGTKIEFR